MIKKALLIVGFICFIVYIGILGTFWILDARRADEPTELITGVIPSGFCERRVALKLATRGVPGPSGRDKVTRINSFSGWPHLVGTVNISTSVGYLPQVPIYVCTPFPRFHFFID